ncbi:short-chain dehydrogenase [Biscogniauxia marginata]|nr:short-chain dehydrogenase [Biscogniauxia marginata]
MRCTVLDFICEQLRELPVPATVEACAGRTFIVTGSNSGIGFETAKHLVQLQAAKVILAVRNTKAGERARADIEAATAAHDSSRKGVAEVWPLDLANYASVRAFARRATADLERIDGLIESAAISLDRWLVAEGSEISVTVNVFSTMLLAVLLLPKMTATGRRFNIVPRLVFVTSSLAFRERDRFQKIEADVWDSLSDRKSKLGNRYGITKLLHLYAAFHFATLAPPSRTGVIVNYTNPGLCKSGLVRHCKLSTRIQVEVMRAILGRTSEMGSRTVLYAMVAGLSSHGQYLSDCKNKNYQVPSWITDSKGKRMQKDIWDGIVEKLEMIEPGCVRKALEC